MEDLARTGIGQFILIDPDVISEVNLATQQTYLEDIGRCKVEAIADRLLQINPDVVVETYPVFLDDLDDSVMGRLANAPLGCGEHTGGAEAGFAAAVETLLLGPTTCATR